MPSKSRRVPTRILPFVLSLTIAPSTLADAGAEPSAGAGQAGMKAYIDPKTGELTGSPPAGTTVPDARFGTHEGLVEEPVPSGGAKVDVRARFQTPLRASIGPDGKTVIKHEGPENTR
ncbi:MAG: hypothetical protein ACREWG_13020 [Gammaproteobacteria bacterium]